MTQVRVPAVAGAFYPADPTRLAGMIDELLREAAPLPFDVVPRMVIVPHAGYIYSGPIAATAYAVVRDQPVTRVALLGPSHYMRFSCLALPGWEGFATPLGTVEVDPSLLAVAKTHAAEVPDAHLREHSLEVQLPFLQTVASGSAVLPVLTGDDDFEPAASLLYELVTRTDAHVVISSDLSHYLAHDTAQLLDAETADAIVTLRADLVGTGRACGHTAVQAALTTAKTLGWRCRMLDLRTSGDTQGDRRRVVGYGAFVLGPPRG